MVSAIRSAFMQLAFGFKAHSGWAALTVIGMTTFNGNLSNAFVVMSRRRVELFEEVWAKQPYHAAEGLAPQEARLVVRKGIDAARRIAKREMRAMIKRELNRGNKVVACAVLTGNPMPEWSVEDILAVHFRMHKAEGVLFQDVLLRASKQCSLATVSVNEKSLLKEASIALKISPEKVAKQLAALGKLAGPPWAKDQKEAALAAMIAWRISEAA